MKKIFTLTLSSLIALAVFADHHPVVTLKAGRHYEIVINGRIYSSLNGYPVSIPNLRKGKHVVKVYEIDQRPLFRKSRRLVSTNVFRLQNRNVDIIVNMRGAVQIRELKHGRNNRWYYDDFGRDRNRDGRPDRW